MMLESNLYYRGSLFPQMQLWQDSDRTSENS